MRPYKIIQSNLLLLISILLCISLQQLAYAQDGESLYTVSGYVYEDTDQDGIYDPFSGDIPLSDYPVTLEFIDVEFLEFVGFNIDDLVQEGVFYTDETGYYSIDLSESVNQAATIDYLQNLYNLRIDVPNENLIHGFNNNVIVVPNQYGTQGAETSFDFGFVDNMPVTGYVFHDVNQDNQYSIDDGDISFSNIPLLVTTYNPDTLETEYVSIMTDQSGYYSFSPLSLYSGYLGLHPLKIEADGSTPEDYDPELNSLPEGYEYINKSVFPAGSQQDSEDSEPYNYIRYNNDIYIDMVHTPTPTVTVTPVPPTSDAWDLVGYPGGSPRYPATLNGIFSNVSDEEYRYFEDVLIQLWYLDPITQQPEFIVSSTTTDEFGAYTFSQEIYPDNRYAIQVDSETLPTKYSFTSNGIKLDTFSAKEVRFVNIDLEIASDSIETPDPATVLLPDGSTIFLPTETPSTLIFPAENPTAVTLTKTDQSNSSQFFLYGLMGMAIASTAVTILRKRS